MRPDSLQVAKRLIVLKYVVAHALTAPPRDVVDALRAKWGQAEIDRFLDECRRRRDAFWEPLKDLRLWVELTDDERAFADTTIATMTEAQQTAAAALIEAVQVHLWALGAVDELPTIGIAAEPSLLRSVPGRAPHVARFVTDARLRTPDAIDAMRHRTEVEARSSQDPTTAERLRALNWLCGVENA